MSKCRVHEAQRNARVEHRREVDHACIALRFMHPTWGRKTAKIHPRASSSAKLRESLSLLPGAFMVEQNGEVRNAVAALTTEILKLTALEGDAKAALSVTIENALSRLADAIMSQSDQVQEKCLEEAIVAS